MTSEGGAGAREFDMLVGPWIEPGYRLAVSILRDHEEARDAVQEAALKAWRGLGRLRDTTQTRAWFFSILANQCRSTMRRRWWRSFGVASREQWQEEGPEDAAVQSMDIDLAMKHLSPDDRAVLHMRFFADMPFEDIGQVLGISAGAAKMRVFRAARRLRPRLTEEDLQ